MSIKFKKMKRDLFRSYLVQGANLTFEGLPEIENWMVPEKCPNNILYWEHRNLARKLDCISYYCGNLENYQPQKNQQRVIAELQVNSMAIGLDLRSYDNLDEIPRNSQIYINFATSYYLGLHGVKVIPYIILGNFDMLKFQIKAIPNHKLIAISDSNINANENEICSELMYINEYLKPLGICYFGNSLFIEEKIINLNLNLYRYTETNLGYSLSIFSNYGD